MNTNNLEQLVQASEEFIAFHRSVNLIREVLNMNVNQIQEDEHVKVVGKINLSKDYDDPYGDRPSMSEDCL
jgi:hypothetical protein